MGKRQLALGLVFVVALLAFAFVFARRTRTEAGLEPPF
ncbi:hypothetical protein SAMN05421858_1315 [Haladaptatus litoreus]|uniref:Uncharacterized protein n=1 Tax=Haladaptatus litoreus TaxID=553468 RepID=A0A1N6XXR0_9EURY|nr:hypothetical protein SAMN05421858_1315 [Haladaptatus litoreus]